MKMTNTDLVSIELTQKQISELCRETSTNHGCRIDPDGHAQARKQPSPDKRGQLMESAQQTQLKFFGLQGWRFSLDGKTWSSGFRTEAEAAEAAQQAEAK